MGKKNIRESLVRLKELSNYGLKEHNSINLNKKYKWNPILSIMNI